jgi:hypothetical protein
VPRPGYPDAAPTPLRSEAPHYVRAARLANKRLVTVDGDCRAVTDRRIRRGSADRRPCGSTPSTASRSPNLHSCPLQNRPRQREGGGSAGPTACRYECPERNTLAAVAGGEQHNPSSSRAVSPSEAWAGSAWAGAHRQQRLVVQLDPGAASESLDLPAEGPGTELVGGRMGGGQRVDGTGRVAAGG